MRRYWVPASALANQQVTLDAETFHHICHVCRQAEGDQFEVICDHKAYLVEITSVGKKSAVARVLQQRPLPELKRPHIHLALSLPRFQTVDRVLEKMVELGVAQVHLFASDFSFKKPKVGELANKMQRWQKIIKGATQQTGRGDLMALTDVEPLRVLLENHFPAAERVGLLAYEGEGGISMAEEIAQLPSGLDEVWIFVGAEGGFSQLDLELFKDYKLLPVSLGDQVLRVETACVTLVSILRYSLGHL